jgi:glutathione S-transferase
MGSDASSALPESLVINEFLEDAFPDAKPLLPKDAFAKARVRLSIDTVSKSIIPVFFRLMQSQEEGSRKEAREALTAGLNKWFGDSLNGSIKKGGFWAGEEITLADLTLIPWIGRLYISEIFSWHRWPHDNLASVEKHRDFDVSAVEGLEEYRKKVLALEHVRNTMSDPDKCALRCPLSSLAHALADEEIYGRYLRDEAQSEAAKATREGKSGFF